jgi:AcrR family transcriptional regulator
MTPRTLRSDAQQNRDGLIAVAADAFASAGPEVTLKEIARRAGVGIGTLYRHFPTREALVDAVYSVETQRLCDSAPELLERLEPVDALREWTLGFLDYMATKHGMADVLHTILTADEERRLDTRARLADALAQLVSAGQAVGQLRADLEVGDLFMALGGFVLMLEHEKGGRETAARLLDLLLVGLLSR